MTLLWLRGLKCSFRVRLISCFSVEHFRSNLHRIVAFLGNLT